MPETLDSTLVTTKNLVGDSGAWISLLEVTILGSGTVWRICDNNSNVTWNGNTWTAWPLEIGEFELSADNKTVTFSIRASNMLQTVSTLIRAAGGISGSSLTMRSVHSNALSVTTNILSVVAKILDASDVDDGWITFSCGSENLFHKRFGNIFKANHCRWLERGGFKGTYCGYSGAVTTCDGRFATCITIGNQARFGGFPGLVGEFAIVDEE